MSRSCRLSSLCLSRSNFSAIASRQPAWQSVRCCLFLENSDTRFLSSALAFFFFPDCHKNPPPSAAKRVTVPEMPAMMSIGSSDSLILSGIETAATTRPARRQGMITIEAMTASEKAHRTLDRVSIAFASFRISSISVLRCSISCLPSGKGGLSEAASAEFTGLS